MPRTIWWRSGTTVALTSPALDARSLTFACMKKPFYCKKHAENGIADIHSNRCSHDSCTGWSWLRYISDRSVSVCARHKDNLTAGLLVDSNSYLMPLVVDWWQDGVSPPQGLSTAALMAASEKGCQAFPEPIAAGVDRPPHRIAPNGGPRLL